MHYKLACDVLETEAYGYDHAAFLMGAQGPDPYYYNVLGPRSQISRHIGDRLHDTRINVMFAAAIDYVQRYPSPWLEAYFAGFLCHYALDRHLHPYVYHHVGVYDEKKPETAVMRGLHLKFERAIDVRLMTEQTGKPAYRYPLHRALPIRRTPVELQKFYDHLVRFTLSLEDGGTLFVKGHTMMRRIIRHVMRDRTGLKRRVYRWLDRKESGRDLFLEDLSFRTPPPDFDVLNRTHTTWFHPVTGVPSSKSVDDLYLDAYALTRTLLDYFGPALKSGQPVAVEAWFENRSFNSGVDCDDPRPMRHIRLFTQDTR
ncbi:MAG: hypothetical protein EA374_02640 [Acholeplasmatales bacterium]|nr:MAG: hypothetical protein EA374_02640 [Acholeplasmatales bacterium]